MARNHPLDVDDILHADRDPMERAAVYASRHLARHVSRLLQRTLVRDGDKAVQFAIEMVNSA